jgi:hypothetical protein
MAGDSTTHTVNGVVLSQEDFDVLPPTSQMEERLKVLLLHAQLQAAAEKHRAEMEALAYRSNPNIHGSLEQELQGKNLPPVCHTVSKVVLGVPMKHILEIVKGTFSFFDLPRLRPNVEAVASSNPLEVIDGKITAVRATGDYKLFKGTMEIWASGFTNYIAIMSMVHSNLEPDWCASALMFVERIRRLNGIYPWVEQVLRYAVCYPDHLAEQSQTTSSAAWRSPPSEWQDQYCHTPKTRSTTKATAGSNSTATGVCRAFQSTKGCLTENCPYRHVAKA